MIFLITSYVSFLLSGNKDSTESFLLRYSFFLSVYLSLLSHLLLAFTDTRTWKHTNRGNVNFSYKEKLWKFRPILELMFFGKYYCCWKYYHNPTVYIHGITIFSSPFVIWKREWRWRSRMIQKEREREKETQSFPILFGFFTFSFLLFFLLSHTKTFFSFGKSQSVRMKVK